MRGPITKVVSDQPSDCPVALTFVLVRLGGYLRPRRAAFVRLQDSHLFEDAGEVRDRTFIYRWRLLIMPWLLNFRQASACENRQES